MDKEIVVIIDKNGDLFSLWTDDIDLREAGTCKAWRASDIVWNEMDQSWDVILLDKDTQVYLGTWNSREEATRQEIKYLQSKM